MKDKEDWDDGRVIAPMNGDELPASRRIFTSKRTEKRVKSDITRKERRAMTFAMFAALLPRLLIVLLGFGIAAVIVVLWLC